MQSDDRLQLALAALAGPIAEFRQALSGALGQAEAFLASRRADPDARRARAALELGRFAEGRVDAAAFANVFSNAGPLPADDEARLESAIAALRAILIRGDDPFITRVAPGDDLGQVVETALARLGRAFGAVLAIEQIRAGTFKPEEHDRLLDVLAFRSWTKAERRYAPPLIVLVAGGDLQAAELSRYADGREKIVLVVSEPCPPAPLVRLITPGTFVLQASDATGLDRFAAFEGPAIAALVPETAARFVHDPAGGREAWHRLTISYLPPVPVRSLGGSSVWQMAEDLRQLESLAAAPTAPPLPTGATADGDGADAVNRLTSWLLQQSGLHGKS